jgi:hypothetical protein
MSIMFASVPHYKPAIGCQEQMNRVANYNATNPDMHNHSCVVRQKPHDESARKGTSGAKVEKQKRDKTIPKNRQYNAERKKHFKKIHRAHSRSIARRR